MVVLGVFQRLITWVRSLTQRHVGRSASQQHSEDGTDDGQDRELPPGGNTVQESLYHIQVRRQHVVGLDESRRPTDTDECNNLALVYGLHEAHTTQHPRLHRCPGDAPGSGDLCEAAANTPVNEGLSHATTIPLLDDSPATHEDNHDAKIVTLDDDREAEEMNGGHFRQGSFSLSLRQMRVCMARVGVVRTRFPPEPNGPLHLGHAKAIFINFSVARKYGGKCILRFDDTNPRKARQIYCNEILEMVRWLGYWPDSVSHTSDYFDQLIVSAYQLILDGAAFVCHQQPGGAGQDQNAEQSPWRNRSIEENMNEFKWMCLGRYKEGEAVLRLKIRTRSGIRDPVAYRICTTEHYRTGKRWCIYPTYDFSHPIIDSWEGIAVSLCSAEFASHRALYQWVQRRMGIHRVPQKEFQRLEVRDFILSKRQLAASLGTSFHAYDDPRLATLSGLRRRGIPPEAIRRFVREGYREYRQLLDITRDVLLRQAKHCMVVLQPLVCHVINYNEVAAAEGEAGQPCVSLQVPECQTGPNNLGHPVILRSVIYINKFDFQLRESRHCFTPRLPVHLRGTCYTMHFSSMARNTDDDSVASLQVVLRKVQGRVKSMKILTWVSDPVPVTINLFNTLVKNEASPRSPFPPVYSTRALMEAGPFNSLRRGRFFTYGQTLQAERFAYITLDQPSSSSSSCVDEPVFNVTCLLPLHPRFQHSILQVFTLPCSPPPRHPSQLSSA